MCFREASLPVAVVSTPPGTILVEVPRAAAPGIAQAVVDARLSSHDRRSDLDRPGCPYGEVGNCTGHGPLEGGDRGRIGDEQPALQAR